MHFCQYIVLLTIFLFGAWFSLSAQDSIPPEGAVQTDTSHVIQSEDSEQNSSEVQGADLPAFNKKNWKSFETEEERIEFYKEWKTKDSAKIEEKMRLKPEQRAIMSKLYKELSFFEKIRYRMGENKIRRKQKKQYRTEKRKFKKTIKWSKPDVGKNDVKNMEGEQKIRLLKAQNLWESRKEAYRRARVKKRFDKREERLRKRYALSENEKAVLNQGIGRASDAGDKMVYNRAKRKQIVYTEKLTKLRKKRAFKIQDKNTQKRIRRQARRGDKLR